MTIIFWFRQDLRLSDNVALTEATKSSRNLIPIYIFDDELKSIGKAQYWWLHHNIASLQESLIHKGITLILKRGNTEKILIELIKKYQIKKIYWNCCYESYYRKLDSHLKKIFSTLSIEVFIFDSNLFIQPQNIKNQSGNYYKVFTPFYNRISTLIIPRQPLRVPQNLLKTGPLETEKLEDWQLLPKKLNWSLGFNQWKPGEKNAQVLLKRFIKENLKNYFNKRNRPDICSTSQLSPYLHLGIISVYQILAAINKAVINDKTLKQSADVFLRQLIWREFAYYLLWYFPEINKKNFKKKFDNFKWKKNNSHLKAWQKGLTGYPIVDAGMRELWHTAYMHNRVRMIVASFLVKDLLIDWREGEKWFWNTLLDADVANNALGWQWIAGSGPDAAPYFRIFNPILQSKKFDPEGIYIKKWIPELVNVPTKYIHYPANMPLKIMQSSKIHFGIDYPFPIISHNQAKYQALKAYKSLSLK